ncbi:hypothetical protein J2751_000346 [Halorubrum alkaliphilum]|uniref:Helix-turn-helix domain-containing protein n=1 Tax=Halorubrum alkaliphilum TaxID=261290 RepID=A0A8T4GC07_9EURY|nr:helix-turn-helix domain-containing protein [Halorubrum alkaliphilum]MBP1921357.1 hypothetical protein [Halorubrum alkaliphilum]
MPESPDPVRSVPSRSSGAPASNVRDPGYGTSGDGVRARLVAHDPPECPVVDALPDGTVATDVRAITLDDVTIEQFRVEGPIPSDGSAPAAPVFEVDGARVYRRQVEPRDACPYRTIESLGYPVADATVRTNPDRLRVTVHLPTVEPLGGIVDAVESTGATVTLDRLTHSGDHERADPVVVDRRRLTDRQREVLCAAWRLGYFSYPREASAEEVAEAVGIARSTFAEHLAAAQRRMIGVVVDGGTDAIGHDG